MRITDFELSFNSFAGIVSSLLFVVVHAAANDEVAAHTGTLRGVVKIEGGFPQVPPLKIQPKRMLVIPRDQADRDRNQREIETSPVVEIPDESLVVGETGGVANVVVYLQQAPAQWSPTPPSRRPVLLEGLEHRFAPHLSLIRVGQSLTLKASENCGECFDFSPRNSQAQNRLVPKNSEVTIENPFQKPERIAVRVNHSIHPWKQAWILPLDHPFAAITDQDGWFVIAGLPPGEHQFHVWHERTGWLEKKLALRVAAGETAELNLKYPGERFEVKHAAANPPKPAAEILKLRDERRPANDRDAARKLFGNWRLNLPAGFEYEVSLTAAGDGCVILGGQPGNNVQGVFAVKDSRLVLVNHGDEGILDFIWQVNDEETLTLVHEETRVGARYVGAKLRRIKPAAAPVDRRDEWGEERDGLRTRLVLVTEKPRLGEPLLVRLELKNVGDQPQEFDAQQAAVNGSLTVIGPDGKPVPYIDLSYQTAGQIQTIKPGATIVLVEKLDLATQYLWTKPGRHTVQWTRGGRGFKTVVKGPVKAGELPKFDTIETAFVPNSNTLTIDIAAGPLPPKIAAFVRLRDIAPKGWNVSQAGGAIFFSHTPTSLKADVTTIQLWFTPEPLAADFKLAPGDTQVINHLEKTPIGHAHLAAQAKAKQLWPEYVEAIRLALQAN